MPVISKRPFSGAGKRTDGDHDGLKLGLSEGESDGESEGERLGLRLGLKLGLGDKKRKSNAWA